MTVSQPTVFISYSHKDEAWKDRLVGHLRVLQFEGELEVWDDRRIEAGDEWRPEIEQAIDHATLAILIISKSFLTSKFIRERELTRILSRRSRHQLRVIPLIAEPCAWQVVSALQGIQTRPQDGRPLSGGSAHQIEADLAALALEIRETPGRGGVTVRDQAKSDRVRPGQRLLKSPAWVMFPTAALALLTLSATYWRQETHVRVDVVTRRVSFVVRGERTQNLLNQSAQFSELTVERCGTVSFSVAQIRHVEPTGPARSGRPPVPGPIRFTCDDPGAKVTLADAGDTGAVIGALDRVVAEPGATVIVEVHGQTIPVVTLDVSTRQQLSLPIHRSLRIVTELVGTEPASLASPSSPSIYEARLPEADRMIRIHSAEEGVVLVMRPTAASASDLLNARLPLESVRFFDEQIGGEIRSAFLESGTLSYPDYPDARPVVIADDEFLDLNRATAMVLRRISLRHNAPGMRLTLEGNLAKGRIGQPDPSTSGAAGVWFDPRLTLLQTIRYGFSWSAVAAVAAWAMSTTWLGYRRWKTPRS